MLQGREMAHSLRCAAIVLDDNGKPDTADRCRAGADEIIRLLDVIRTRDKHIAELQAQIPHLTDTTPAMQDGESA